MREELIARLEAETGAIRSGIPGLWWLPDHPELTLGQLMDVAAKRARGGA